MIPDYFYGHLKILIEKSVTVKGQEVHWCNWQWGLNANVYNKLPTMPLCP